MRQRLRRSDPLTRYDDAQKKRQARGARKRPATLLDAPTGDLRLGNVDDLDIKDAWVAKAIDRAFMKATRSWTKINPVRSSRKGKGWGDDLRATRSVGETNEREYHDERPYGSGRPRSDDEDDESGVAGSLERAEQSRPVPADGGPTFYVVGRDSRPLPAYRSHPSTVLDAGLGGWQQQYSLRLRRGGEGRRRLGN